MKATKKNIRWGFAILLVNIMFFHPVFQSLTYAADPYYAVFRAGNGNNGLYRSENWQTFVAKKKEMRDKGQILVRMDVEKIDGKTWYYGIFRSGSGSNGLFAFNNWKDFITKRKEMKDKYGQILVSMDVEKVDGKTMFYGVYRTSQGGSALYHYDNWEDFVAQWKEMNDKHGQKLVSIDVEKVDGKTWYYGIFRSGSGGNGLFKLGVPLKLHFCRTV